MPNPNQQSESSSPNSADLLVDGTQGLYRDDSGYLYWYHAEAGRWYWYHAQQNGWILLDQVTDSTRIDPPDFWVSQSSNGAPTDGHWLDGTGTNDAIPVPSMVVMADPMPAQHIGSRDHKAEVRQ